MNLSQIKSIYASLENYHINLCSINENNASLIRAFSVIGKKPCWGYSYFVLEKFDAQIENSFGDFLNLPAPKNKLFSAIEEFGSCEIDEKSFINEVIHESNSYNEKWLQE